MRESSTPASRRFSFKSTTKLDPPANRVLVSGGGTAGDPTAGGATGGGASITVYNSNGSGEKTTVTLPAAGWTLTSKGYRFKAALTADPIQRITVKADSVRVRKPMASAQLNEPSQGSTPSGCASGRDRCARTRRRRSAGPTTSSGSRG
jgi:hypothetical protein